MGEMDLKKHLDRAEQALDRGQADFAIELCDQVLDFAPGDANAAGLLARALVSLKAKGGFLGRLSAGPSSLGARLSRMTKNPDAEARQLRRAFIKNPGNFSTAAGWADALERAGYAGAALEAFGALAEADSECAKRASALAAAQGEVDRALEYLERALVANPRDTEAVRMRKNLAAEQALSTKAYDQAGSAKDIAYDPEAFLRASRGEEPPAPGSKTDPSA
jgi:tetratricopeptide (TPR) repeat protein